MREKKIEVTTEKIFNGDGKTGTLELKVTITELPVHYISLSYDPTSVGSMSYDSNKVNIILPILILKELPALIEEFVKEIEEGRKELRC